MKNKNTAPNLEQTTTEETTLLVVKAEEETAKTILNNFKDVSKTIQEEAIILDKWRKLDLTEKKLDSFNLGKDELNDSLVIEDSDGNEFRTTNSEIITEVVELLRHRVSEKKEQLENELIDRRKAA